MRCSRHVTCRRMQRVRCLQHARCTVQGSTWNVRRAPCRMQHATCQSTCQSSQCFVCSLHVHAIARSKQTCMHEHKLTIDGANARAHTRTSASADVVRAPSAARLASCAASSSLLADSPALPMPWQPCTWSGGGEVQRTLRSSSGTAPACSPLASRCAPTREHQSCRRVRHSMAYTHANTRWTSRLSLPCRAVPCLATRCALPCRALPCHALRLSLPCRAVPCVALPCRAVPLRCLPSWRGPGRTEQIVECTPLSR